MIRAYVQHAGLCLRAALTYRLAALSGVATQLAFGCIRVEVLEACYHGQVRATTMSLAAAQDYIWLGQAFLRLAALSDAPVAGSCATTCPRGNRRPPVAPLP